MKNHPHHHPWPTKKKNHLNNKYFKSKTNDILYFNEEDSDRTVFDKLVQTKQLHLISSETTANIDDDNNGYNQNITQIENQNH